MSSPSQYHDWSRQRQFWFRRPFPRHISQLAHFLNLFGQSVSLLAPHLLTISRSLLFMTVPCFRMCSVLMPDANAGSFLRVLVQALESSDLSSHAVANSASCCAPDLTPYRGYAREYVLAYHDRCLTPGVWVRSGTWVLLVFSGSLQDKTQCSNVT